MSAAIQTKTRVPDAPIDAMFVDRWSQRALAPRPIPADDLRALFEAARWAPSASNTQPWLFVYNDDEETLAPARALLNPRNRVWAEKAPLLVFVFARRTNPETGRPLRTGAFDTGAAWLSLALQAHKLGLSTRAMGGINHEAAYELCGVPRDQYESMAAIAIGYPGERTDLPPDVAEREVPSARRNVQTFAFKGRYQPPEPAGAAGRTGHEQRD
jgi:nitroreductase